MKKYKMNLASVSGNDRIHTGYEQMQENSQQQIEPCKTVGVAEFTGARPACHNRALFNPFA